MLNPDDVTLNVVAEQQLIGEKELIMWIPTRKYTSFAKEPDTKVFKIKKNVFL